MARKSSWKTPTGVQCLGEVSFAAKFANLMYCISQIMDIKGKSEYAEIKWSG